LTKIPLNYKLVARILTKLFQVQRFRVQGSRFRVEGSGLKEFCQLKRSIGLSAAVEFLMVYFPADPDLWGSLSNR
jgi:hypothetical protein